MSFTSIVFNFLKSKTEYILFCFFTCLAFLTVNKYGITVDEAQQRYMGFVCGDYVFKNNLYYLSFPDNDHGVVVELPLVIIERVFNFTDTRTIFLMRHFVCHLFFLVSAVYFFKLIILLYNNKTLAVLGFLFLVINPVIYCHSFFNSKDIPFLSMYIICFYQIALAFTHKKMHQFIILGLLSGLLIDIRIMGILIIPIVCFFITIENLVNCNTYNNLKQNIKTCVVYVISSLFFTIAFWPILWKHPINNFVRIFTKMAQFNLVSIVNYRGSFHLTTNIPWHYMPTWFFINNPIMYLFFGLFGCLLVVYVSAKNFKASFNNLLLKNNLIYVCAFLLPVFIVIILHSVVYDGWRHLFAIYPPFILLSIYFLNKILQTKFKTTAIITSLLSVSFVAIFMILNFPFQHVYFNQLVSLRNNEYIKKNYEMDYWGASSKQALEYILDHDSSKSITIYSTNSGTFNNIKILFSHQKARLHYVYNIKNADYFITDYRWHPSNYTSKKLTEIKSFTVLNNKICTIFKVQKQP